MRSHDTDDAVRIGRDLMAPSGWRGGAGFAPDVHSGSRVRHAFSGRDPGRLPGVERETDKDHLIRQDHPVVLGPVDPAGPMQRPHIAMHRVHAASHPAHDLADRQLPLPAIACRMARRTGKSWLPMMRVSIRPSLRLRIEILRQGFDGGDRPCRPQTKPANTISLPNPKAAPRPCPHSNPSAAPPT